MIDSTGGAADQADWMRAITTRRIVVLAITSAGLLVGCDGNGQRSTTKPRQIVASDFSSLADTPVSRADGTSLPGDRAAHRGEAPGADTIDPGAAPRAGDSVAARTTGQDTPVPPIESTSEAQSPPPDPPAAAAMSPAPLRPGEPYVVDRLIGQINGRPIFADEFFAPIEDRLIAARTTMGTVEFVNEVNAVVDSRLQEVALNELFISEAQAALTAEEQMGLSRWQRAVRELLLARSSGIEAEAEQRSQEEGLTLDERLMAIKDEALVRRLIDQKITPRVIVSWRDVEREYRHRFQEFNPPGQIRFTRIVVATEGNEELISEIRSRLAAESFSQVVESLSPSMVSQWGPFLLRDGKIENLPLVDETLKAELAGLSVDDTRGPLAIGRYTWWLHVDSIDQPTARSIYDPQIQRSLYLDLLRQRQIEEQNRYIDSLFTQEVRDDLDTMRSQLRRVALLRYGR